MFPRGGKRQKGIDTPNQAKARSKGVYDRIDWFLQLIKIFYASKSRKDYLDEANLLLPDGFRNIKNFNDKFDYIYSSLENYKDEFLYFKNFEGFCDCFKLVGSLVDREYNVVEMTKFFQYYQRITRSISRIFVVLLKQGTKDFICHMMSF